MSQTLYLGNRALRESEARVSGHDKDVEALFDAIKRLAEPPVEGAKGIGFRL